MHINDIIILKIDETNILGCGVARHCGMIVFCEGAIEGDTVKAVVTSVKSNYGTATTMEIISPSKHRIKPLCPYFGKCGGCTFSNITYEHELSVKKAAIENAFRRCGITDVYVSDILHGDEYNYRNKAVFRFDSEKNICFYARKSNDFAKVDECLTVSPAINIIMKESERLIKSSDSLSPSDLTYLYIRHMPKTDEASVTVGYKGENSLLNFATSLCKSLPNVKCIMQGKERNPESKKERLLPIFGSEKINGLFCSLKTEISPRAFFQVNHIVAEMICKTVSESSELEADDTFIDLYCGTGIIGLTVAAEHPYAKIIGVEINESSVKNAKENARANGITNAEFYCRDSADAAGLFNETVKCLAVDPPRTGLSKDTVSEIKNIAPKNIIYVSCNPSTLARDIKNLSDSYKINRVLSADLFPRTSHVETVVLMSRTKQ